MSVTIDKLKPVFLAALGKTTAAERDAFLAEACAGDPDLRRGVEALLRAHDQADPLLDRPAAEYLEPRPSGEHVAPGDSLGFLDPPAKPDSLGRIGHYEVLEVLGRGGFGIVLRAFDDKLHRVVAVKVLAPELATSSPARKRFVREARSSAMVRHENVVQVHAVEEQPLPYLVMEFIPGETLQERLDRTGPFGLAELLQIGRQIAEGLAAAHARGLVHRDIKPANILIEAGASPRVKITDFGLARAADDASTTRSGLLAGTPMYMAPEQAHGERLDHRADLFSLGSVLYAMCSGRPPFRADSALAVLKRVAEDTPRPIQEIIPEAPQWLCDTIARLQAKRPEDRFATAREVADLLARPPAETEPLRTAEVRPGGAPAAAGVLHGRAASTVEPAIRRLGPGGRRWAAAAAVLLLIGGLGLTEAAGVTDVRGTVVRLFSPEGTLVVEVDDPEVSVQVDGSDLVITGAGPREIRLEPGTYAVEARKGGELVGRELVAVEKNGRRVVRVSREATPPVAATQTSPAGPPAPFTDADVRRVAALPAAGQVEEVRTELMRRNPAFGSIHSSVTHKIAGNVVTEFSIVGLQVDKVTDISPVRALTGLRSFACRSGDELSDLSPLEDLHLSSLDLGGLGVADLSALKDMKLRTLTLYVTSVADLSPLEDHRTLVALDVYHAPLADLSPLKHVKLTSLSLGRTRVTDLSPLQGMRLTTLKIDENAISDLTPVKGMPLAVLSCKDTNVTDLSPLAGMPLEILSGHFDAPRDAEVLGAIETLKTINGKPATEFWNGVRSAKQRLVENVPGSELPSPPLQSPPPTK